MFHYPMAAYLPSITGIGTGLRAAAVPAGASKAQRARCIKGTLNTSSVAGQRTNESEVP